MLKTEVLSAVNQGGRRGKNFRLEMNELGKSDKILALTKLVA